MVNASRLASPALPALGLLAGEDEVDRLGNGARGRRVPQLRPQLRLALAPMDRGRHGPWITFHALNYFKNTVENSLQCETMFLPFLYEN